jgi:hypothetical protein
MTKVRREGFLFPLFSNRFLGTPFEKSNRKSNVRDGFDENVQCELSFNPSIKKY